MYRHAQVMVHGIAGLADAAGQLALLIQPVEHLFALVKREEISNTVWIFAMVRPFSRWGVIEDKAVFTSVFAFRPIKLGEIFPHVVEVIPLVVQLEQAIYVKVALFVGMRCLRVEEIIQRFRGGFVRDGLAGCFLPKADKIFAQVLDISRSIGISRVSIWVILCIIFMIAGKLVVFDQFIITRIIISQNLIRH